jgi:hypothetical protein
MTAECARDIGGVPFEVVTGIYQKRCPPQCQILRASVRHTSGDQTGARNTKSGTAFEVSDRSALFVGPSNKSCFFICVARARP